MEKIKAVIFDIDGTLANTLPLIIQSFRQAVEPLVHRPLSDDEIEATFGPTEEGSIKKLTPDNYKKGLADFTRIYKESMDMYPHPFDGVTALLTTLKSKGIKMAVATGKGKELTDFTLQYYKLTGFFDMIQTGSPEGSRKVEAIHLILDSWPSIKKDEVIYVGDSPGDIKESHEAGIAAVAAAWAETAKPDKQKEEKPDEIFYTVKDFAEWLGTKI